MNKAVIGFAREKSVEMTIEKKTYVNTQLHSSSSFLAKDCWRPS